MVACYRSSGSKTLCVCLDGTLHFASYYRDHMVLQKSPEKAVLWGYGPEGAQVTLLLSGPGKQRASLANVTKGEHKPGGRVTADIDRVPECKQGPHRVNPHSGRYGREGPVL